MSLLKQSSPEFNEIVKGILNPSRYGAAIIACFLSGIIILVIMLFTLILQLSFLFHATTVEVTIVDISYEHVAKGRGSALAYVPIVEVRGPDTSLRTIKVDTYSESLSFNVGDSMNVICDLPESNKCVRNTFSDLWAGKLLVAGIGLAFIFLGGLLRKRLEAQELSKTAGMNNAFTLL